MYSPEDRRRAVELFIKYDLSCTSVINELGYPTRGSLYSWYRDCLESGERSFGPGGHRRYSDDQKRAAVDHFFEHGQCIARTVRALGYPRSKELLAAWIDELEPGRRIRRATGKKFTEAQIRNAVIELEARKLPAAAIAGELGVERATLYQWKRRFLGEGVPCKMPKTMSCCPMTQVSSRSRSGSSSSRRRSWRGRSSSWEKTPASTPRC